jgi:hypothetical protein
MHGQPACSARDKQETSRLTQNAMPAPRDVHAPAAHTIPKARPTLPSCAGGAAIKYDTSQS